MEDGGQRLCGVLLLAVESMRTSVPWWAWRVLRRTKNPVQGFLGWHWATGKARGEMEMRKWRERPGWWDLQVFQKGTLEVRDV